MSKLLTIKEAAEFLGVHTNTLRQWDRTGYIKALRVGVRGDRKYREEELRKAISGDIELPVDNNA